MSAIRRVQTIVTIEAALTAVVGLLLSYFGLTAWTWVDGTETKVAALESRSAQLEIAFASARSLDEARWDEILRRLNSIDERLKDLQRH